MFEGGKLLSMKDMSERDICTKYITPAIAQAGWDIHKQIREEYFFTDGRVMVRGDVATRGNRKRADYLLFYKANLPIAVIEAKDNNHNLGDGIQQAINYALIMDVPFAYASNGDGFVEHDLTTGKETTLELDKFPSCEELWNRHLFYKGITTPEQKAVVAEPYHFAVGGNSPRYYQRIAINRAIEAIAKGRDRLLLVMATGTGKTYTAFQILWRLWKAGKIKKILYLADRNILIDQTMTNDFAPFDKSITKVVKRTLESAYEIHMALYQQLVGNDGEEIFREFKPDYFDMIIVDECHRGSAKEESAWRKILEYFKPAVQLGMTATPKETNKISNIDYFGEPLFTYSLKQGIEDGFLAPFKVIRVGINKDLLGYRPAIGDTDIYGNEIEDREYNIVDFDRKIVIDERTTVVAKKISDYLKKNDRFAKTIVFCVDIEHATRMRQALIEENQDLVKENPNYIMKITGDDDLGKAQLDNFISMNSKYPVVAVTSKLMTTGVDAKMCKLIVLDSNIQSMIEFKQIIGRGTRLRYDEGKRYFTIMDFRDVSRLFADPAFDGEPFRVIDIPVGGDFPPVDVDYPGVDEGPFTPPGGTHEPPPVGGDDGSPQEKVYVRGVYVTVLNERVQYLDNAGKLITESVRDYSKKHILEQYDTIDKFIKRWNEVDKKQAIIDELKEEGVLLEALKAEIGKDIDAFDLILHVAFDKKPLTKRERVENVHKLGYLNKYSAIAQTVLEKLLDKYKDETAYELEDTKILELKPFDEIGSSLKIVKAFGGKKQYIEAVREMESYLYA